MLKIYEHEHIVEHDAVVVALDGSEETYHIQRTELYWTVECRDCGVKSGDRGRSGISQYQLLDSALHAQILSDGCDCEEETNVGGKAELKARAAKLLLKQLKGGDDDDTV